MIILITEVQSISHLNPNAHRVSFRIVDGRPDLDAIERYLNQELNCVLALSYLPATQQGSFINLENECVQGMHFNEEDHYEILER